MKLTMKLVAGSLVTALFTGLAVLGGASVANAVAIPVPVLGECPIGFDASAVGGWDKRDAISEGSELAGELPTRKRLARFGEPCTIGNVLYMPWQLTDQVVPMVDEDDDGKDDPYKPAACAGGAEPSSTPPGYQEWLDDQPLCGRIQLRAHSGTAWLDELGTWLEFGVEVVSATTADVQLGVIDVPAAGNGSSLSYACMITATEVVAFGGSVNLFNAFSETTQTLTCPAGRTLYAVYTGRGAFPGHAAASGLLWHVDGGGAVPGVVGYYGGTVAAEFDFFATSFGTGHTVPAPWLLRSNLICSSDYAGGTLTTHELQLGYQASGEFEAEPPVVEDGVAVSWSTSGEFLIADYSFLGCGFVERIENWVCSWPPPLQIFTCDLHEWSGDRWRDKHQYNPSSPEDALCESPGGGWLEFDWDCVDILFPPYVDPTDFESVCGDPPVWNPPGWDVNQYIPSLIGFLGVWFAHYGTCLFVPQGGFDRQGLVVEAWEATAGGEAAEVFDHMVASMEVSGYCGVIAAGDIQGADFIIDTCSWGWAVPLRDFLFWAILLFGGFSILMFIVRVVLSVVGFSPMPMPLEDKDGGPEFK